MDLLSRIKALPKEISDKIAAGEVVERPLSIIKELLENSIDAGAKAIVLEIKNGGKSYIRVTDDGSGIEKEDVPLAFARYATSKISREDDLYALTTLGFRGEALASIAAVSNVELITKTKNSKVGTKIVLEGGDCNGIFDTACEEGTTIIITNLFYNTPVRKKFLKPDNTEAALIIDFASKMALAYPNIKIRLINNETILFATSGKGNIYQNILTVYSKQTVEHLIEIHSYDEYEGFELNGYVSSPNHSNSNQRQQVFFVNGRWIKSKIFETALKEAYNDKLFEGKHPATFLFFAIAPQKIDVNIHPNKTEVRFFDEKKVKEFITAEIRKALLQERAAPELSAIVKKSADSVAKENDDGFEQINMQHVRFVEKAAHYDEIFSEMRADTVYEGNILEEKEKSYPEYRRFLFSDLNILGSVFETYILSSGEDSLYIVDQHAAHERIMFERLSSSYIKENPSGQILLTPFLVELPTYLKESAKGRLELLTNIGYLLEEFGPKEFLVKEIPACMDLQEAETFVYEVLEKEPEDTKASPKEQSAKIISAACKAAVKANDKLSESEIRELFIALDATENPFSCPHGRPTFVRFSLSEMERLFKRK